MGFRGGSKVREGVVGKSAGSWHLHALTGSPQEETYVHSLHERRVVRAVLGELGSSRVGRQLAGNQRQLAAASVIQANP